MSKRKPTDESRQMTETRREAEQFVMSHKGLLDGASKDEVNAAIGKIGRVLWDLKQARSRVESGQR